MTGNSEAARVRKRKRQETEFEYLGPVAMSAELARVAKLAERQALEGVAYMVAAIRHPLDSR